MPRTIWITLTALVVALLAEHRQVDACSIATPDEFVVDADQAALDTEPPAITAASFEVHRFEESGGCAGNSCEGVVTATITVDAADNRFAADQIGFDIRVVSGDVPLEVPTAVSSFANGDGTVDLVFGWPSDDPESGTLEITPIDLAGNVGQPFTLEISAPGEGSKVAGRAGGKRGGAAWLLVGLALVIGFRRRSPC